jgi:hypothetical protein
MLSSEYENAQRQEKLARLVPFLIGEMPFCGDLIKHLTPRIAGELSLIGNAFICGGEPTRGDVFNFLWRLNPAFARPEALSLRARFIRWRLKWVVSRVDLARVRVKIREYLDDQFLDSHTGVKADDKDEKPEKVTWLAYRAYFFMSHFGMSYIDFMDTPIPVLNQLQKAYLICHGREDEMINKSEIIRARELQKLAKSCLNKS